ncbi:hypothetical protein Tco_0637828, partial [Tanacetum coccineum]
TTYVNVSHARAFCSVFLALVIFSSCLFLLLLLSCLLPALSKQSLLSFLFLLLAYRCLLIDSYLSRLLLADSCLTTLACRLLLADSCLATLAWRLLLGDSYLSTLAC